MLALFGLIAFAGANLHHAVFAGAFAVFVLIWLVCGLMIAVALGRREKGSYAVVICTAGGEFRALVSKDEARIDKVIRALNRVIEDRG